MAPITQSQPFSVVLSVRNRTGIPLTLFSEHFDSNRPQRLTQNPKALQDILCNIDLDRSRPLSIDVLDEDCTETIVSLPLQIYHVAGGSKDNNLRPSSRWKSVEAVGRIKLLHRRISVFSIQLMILKVRDPATFLSCLPDTAPLTSLSLPGTHNSLARFGWPFSSCQSPSSSVKKQLYDGIRYLDIRLAPKGQGGIERLVAYHGIKDQCLEFSQVLEDCFAFLDGVGQKETIIMSLKQESGVQDLFIKLLFSIYVDRSPASKVSHLQGRQRWFLEDRIPSLGEARGKIIMLSRFVIAKSYGFPGGISPPIWTHNEKGSFHYRLRGSNQLVHTQDWHDIGSLSLLSDKFALIKKLCQDSGSDDDVLSLNYCSGSSFPFAFPPSVAKGILHNGSTEPEEQSTMVRLLSAEGINSQLKTFIADALFRSEQGSAGRVGAAELCKVVWALDYYNEPRGVADLVDLLVETNF
ncbi:hypothetical protein CBS101457_005387 [Exobasidium rhododendri]|nr:hypothetical protein CBS101457_005387 [Exobasidium rhododendri]